MNTNEEKLKQDVLQMAHLQEFPAKATKTTVWIEAIGQFLLANGSTAYGIVKRTADLEGYHVMYINGSISAIKELKAVYPYLNLNKEYIQKFKKGDTAGKVKYLQGVKCPATEGKELESLEEAELDKILVQVAVYKQLNNMEE